MAIAVTPISQGHDTDASTVTAGGTTTGGSGTVQVVFINMDPGVTVSSIADSKGNSYNQVGTPTVNGSARLAVYECVNGTGGSSHTVTVNFSGSAFAPVYHYEVTGAETSNPRDVNVAVNTDSTRTWDISSGTLAQANEALFAFIGNANGGNPVTYSESGGNGWTKSLTEVDGNTYWTGCTFYKIVSSTSSVTANLTDNIGNAAAALRIVSYKEASGGGGGSASPNFLTLVGVGA